MNAVIADQLVQKRSELVRLCGVVDLKELRLFGSATTDQYDPARSDLDFLVDFNHPDEAGIADRYLQLAEGLQSLFGRPVDLVTRRSLRNRVFRRVIEETSQPIYAG